MLTIFEIKWVEFYNLKKNKYKSRLNIFELSKEQKFFIISDAPCLF